MAQVNKITNYIQYNEKNHRNYIRKNYNAAHHSWAEKKILKLRSGKTPILSF